MLKIRMQRMGAINQPSFRIVVTEHTAGPQAGKYVERVGFYNPRSKERTLVEDRIKYWMSVGAKPSGTVHNMLVSAGVLNAKKINVLPRKTVKLAEVATEASAKPAPEGATKEEPSVEMPPEAALAIEAAESVPQSPEPAKGE